MNRLDRQIFSSIDDAKSDACTALAELTTVEEQFALAYFHNGGRLADAYLAVRPGVTRASAYHLGRRMFQKVQVQEAVEKLRAELRERVPADTEVLAQRLYKLATGNMTDVAEWGGTVGGFSRGLEIKPSDELTPEAAALIEEVEFTPGQFGMKKRVKLVNRTAAARLLLELRGELKQVRKHEGEVLHRVMALPEKQPTREQWVERYAPGKREQATKITLEEQDVQDHGAHDP